MCGEYVNAVYLEEPRFRWTARAGACRTLLTLLRDTIRNRRPVSRWSTETCLVGEEGRKEASLVRVMHLVDKESRCAPIALLVVPLR